MSFILFIFSWWPFHHSHQPISTITIGPQVQLGDPVVPESLCIHDDVIGWQLAGPDGAIGISQESCQKAYENWKLQPAPKPLNRV